MRGLLSRILGADDSIPDAGALCGSETGPKAHKRVVGWTPMKPKTNASVESLSPSSRYSRLDYGRCSSGRLARSEDGLDRSMRATLPVPKVWATVCRAGGGSDTAGVGAARRGGPPVASASPVEPRELASKG